MYKRFVRQQCYAGINFDILKNTVVSLQKHTIQLVCKNLFVIYFDIWLNF